MNKLYAFCKRSIVQRKQALTNATDIKGGVIAPMFGISRRIEKLEATFHEVVVTSSTQQVLQAMLAEYNALRVEIQRRSDAQHTLLQLHLTALTLISGAALSQKLGPWIIFLIPIEAAIFGLWWEDHALVIMEIGTYIRESVEPRVSRLLSVEKVMYWETNFKAGAALPKKRRDITFEWLVFITFAGPSVIILVCVPLVITISVLLVNGLLPPELSSGVNPIFFGWGLWIAPLCWLVDLGFLGAYLSLSRYRRITLRGGTISSGR